MPTAPTAPAKLLSAAGRDLDPFARLALQLWMQGNIAVGGAAAPISPSSSSLHSCRSRAAQSASATMEPTRSAKVGSRRTRRAA